MKDYFPSKSVKLFSGVTVSILQVGKKNMVFRKKLNAVGYQNFSELGFFMLL